MKILRPKLILKPGTIIQIIRVLNKDANWTVGDRFTWNNTMNPKPHRKIKGAIPNHKLYEFKVLGTNILEADQRVMVIKGSDFGNLITYSTKSRKKHEVPKTRRS